MRLDNRLSEIKEKTFTRKTKQSKLTTIFSKAKPQKRPYHLKISGINANDEKSLNVMNFQDMN